MYYEIHVMGDIVLHRPEVYGNIIRWKYFPGTSVPHFERTKIENI